MTTNKKKIEKILTEESKLSFQVNKIMDLLSNQKKELREKIEKRAKERIKISKGRIRPEEIKKYEEYIDDILKLL